MLSRTNSIDDKPKLKRIGHKISEETKKILSQQKIGEKNPRYGKFKEQCYNYKGDAVSNNGLHKWVRRHLPKPEKCQLCKEKHPRDLSNITGIYNREFKNWAWFCHKCHLYFDNLIIRNLTGPKKKDISDRRCVVCGKTKTFSWHSLDKNDKSKGYLCNAHYLKKRRGTLILDSNKI